MTCGSQLFAAGRGCWEFFWSKKTRPAPTAGVFCWRHGFSRGFLEFTKISHEFHDLFPIHLFFCSHVFVSFYCLPHFFYKVQNKGSQATEIWNSGWLYNVFPTAPANLDALFDKVGYLPDGTPMNRAGNAINHPETIQPDPHTPGGSVLTVWKLEQVASHNKPKKTLDKLTAFDPPKMEVQFFR